MFCTLPFSGRSCPTVQALVSGFADTAMRHLTGGAPQRWTVRSSDGRGDAADELWARLVRWTSESSPVGCAHSHAVAQKLQAEAARGTQDGISTHSATVFDGCSSSCADAASSSLPKEVHDLGLLRGHAYGLELVREIAGRRLLRLRNPWGRGEWTGAWADGASEWSEELLSALEYSFSDDGTFWMELHDFCTQFNVLYMARLFEGGDWGVRSLRGQWQGRSAAGCPGHNASWRSNPAISFALSQECELFCVLGRSDISKAKCGDALSRPSSPQLVSRTLRPSSPHTRTPSSVQDTLHSLGFALASVSQLVRTAHASSMKGIDIAVSGLPLRYEPEVSSAEESRLRAGIYAIVPFTFRSEIEGAWRLEVRCSRADALHIDRWESVDALIAAHGIGANGIGGSMAQTGPDVNPSQQLSPPQKADLDEMDLWMEVTEDLDPEEAFGHDRYSASGALAFLGSREERRLSREAAALSEAYLAEQCDEMRPAWEAFMSQALSRGDPPHSLATVDDALSRLALKKQEVHHERAFSRAARIGRAPTQRPARTPALTQSLPEDIRQGAAEAVRKAKVELARRQTPAATTTLLGSTTYSPNMLAKTGRHTSLHASDNLATIAASCRRDARPTARVPFQPSSHGSFQRNTNKGASRWEVRMPPPPPHWGAL
mmetsp:Transcript_69/g.280  ORF Transcript_69/g.280 Transcript_69/m.280 type:complete len:661 (-) Transcript_69:177-2159(-)